MSVTEIFQKNLPPRAKKTPSGWTSFNAPCCNHRGENVDTRQRGGVKYHEGFTYNCFNCGFSASWKPGRQISKKLKDLMKWLGAPQNDINQMIFEAMKTESPEYVAKPHIEVVTFKEKDLPKHAMSLMDWSGILEGEIEEQIGPQFIEILRYLMSRGYENPFDYDFYWSPEPGYIDRVIIPFRWEGRIVGNTARKIREGKPKYLSDQPPHFVFNFDQQTEDQKYIFVCEGPFDALSIGGVAVLTNDIAEQQAKIINSLGAEVIVIPDQDRAGLQVIDRALEYGWSVAFPNWGEEVKDCAEAVVKYGKLFVIVDAIKTAVDGEIKITVNRNRLESRIRLDEEAT